MITPKSVNKNNFSREVTKMKFKSMTPETMALVMFVLTEARNEFSRFHNYLSGFPKSFEEYPICFGEDELELLKGSPLYNMVIKTK